MPPPFDLAQFLPYRLSVLADRLSHRLAVEYAALYGLRVADWRVLVHVQRAGRASVRDIHAQTNLDKPKVSRAVVRLQDKGFVHKSSARQDGRLVEIRLTEAGQAALAQIIPVATDVETRLLSALTPAERAQLDAAIDSLHRALDNDPLARPRVGLDTP